jgi:hypothetical protein
MPRCHVPSRFSVHRSGPRVLNTPVSPNEPRKHELVMHQPPNNHPPKDHRPPNFRRHCRILNLPTISIILRQQRPNETKKVSQTVCTWNISRRGREEESKALPNVHTSTVKFTTDSHRVIGMPTEQGSNPQTSYPVKTWGIRMTGASEKVKSSMSHVDSLAPATKSRSTVVFERS